MSKITIGKKEFDVEERIINQNELLFYEENPRIYSILQSSDEPVTQEDIEEILSKMDHVKQLRTSIEQNGGIIDPLIVMERDNNFIVLEGNSRLAAYRLLFKKDPSKWNAVKCNILLGDFLDDDIFTLLGQYHLIGRKNWSVFEQAAYLFRKKKSSDTEIEIIAKSIGLPASTAKQYLRVYTFMREKDDLRPEKWSHYDEYLKNPGIKKYQKTSSEIDDTIVSQIKSGEIKQAVDVRNVLGTLAKGNDKTAKRLMKDVIEKKTSIYDAFDRFEATGKTGGAYTKIKKFKETIADYDFQKKLKIEASATKEIAFELNKIKTSIDKLLREIQD